MKCGTLHSYNAGGCRCEDCKRAKREETQLYRARKAKRKPVAILTPRPPAIGTGHLRDW